ncbi:MAG: glycolate oxidase subunit GlcF [Planctomycetaceae bacterium]|nr:glycolate oxidase subunit GlcF [Planctomycetaceae bacterium]
MQHNIPVGELPPRGEEMAKAVQTCVHCGFCLPTCPTYQVLGQETDSPRGRIFLMKEVLEGKLEVADVQKHLDQCLGCLACQTACPSGVHYGDLISPFRDWVRETGEQPWSLRRWIASLVLPRPWLFRLALQAGQLVRNRLWLVPPTLRPMVAMVPPEVPKEIKLAEFTPAQGTKRGTVALLAGCAQQVLSPDINAATIRVLSRQGFDVVIPPTQGCCGALAWHVGNGPLAKTQARTNIKAFEIECDAILSNAAGCGSGLKEYGLILKGESDESAGKKFATRVRDVCEFLDEVGLIDPPTLASPMRVAYHDACHLAHAQGVTSAPRKLLRSIKQLELAELEHGEICCGSAGTYNIDQPLLAAELGKRKAESVITTGACCLVTGNIGCMVQIHQSLAKLGHPLPVLHTIQLLDQAYSAKK